MLRPPELPVADSWVKSKLIMSSVVPVPEQAPEGPEQVSVASAGARPAEESPILVSGRIPVLDGLRGLAILSVLLWHSVFQLEWHGRIMSALPMFGRLSWSGVDLFFVLSGFLIGGILLDVKESPRYFRTFYARRAYRILPIYAVVLVLYGLGRLTLLPYAPGFADFWIGRVPWFSYATFTQNLGMAYESSYGPFALIVTWSLAIEEQFYLTVPMVVRRLSRPRLAIVLGCVVLAAPLLRTLLYLNVNHGGFVSYVLTPCRADALSLGVLCALLVRDARLSRLLVARRTILCIAASLLLGVLIWFTYRGYGQYSAPLVTVGYSVLAFFYTCCLLIALTSRGWVRRALSNRPLMGLGGIAYCTYLLHHPIMEACRRLLGPDGGLKTALGSLFGVMITLTVAKLSWLLFEEPMIRRGHAYKY